MCGRFTQAYSWSEVHAFLDLTGPARNLRPRYNIAPTTTIDVARLGEGGRELVPMRWGLAPLGGKSRLRNFPRPSMHEPKRLLKSQCFVPPSSRAAASSRRRDFPNGPDRRVIERRTIFRRRQVSRSRSRVYGKAGAISESREIVLSATIVVGAANEWMTRYHDRAPVMIEQKDFDAWLVGEDAALQPAKEDALREWIVSPRVNRSGVGDDDPTMIERVS